ncbi:hypothetical protein BDQ94DRAFT_155579 [Aspergillus welwitschiae]|uniref:Uncharacterized protein n=1 Tax=Aspergillus welwitschiae TaxID=1341132 RepID=A0A3F3PHT5_9EURO|nr:hypothetical protein BDQ94DRAFT_155579 [Aspergillus welwitschiae]RDH26427.1 hypothetical protein BDQ94DRAFT_155579 [Aspergillus welwitschiae]
MAARPRRIQKRLSDSLKSKRQQQSRRKDNLFFKSFEYCHECDADIFIMVRNKKTGQILFFNSNSSWPPSLEELASYYPKPKQITWKELAARYAIKESQNVLSDQQQAQATEKVHSAVTGSRNESEVVAYRIDCEGPGTANDTRVCS